MDPADAFTFGNIQKTCEDSMIEVASGDISALSQLYDQYRKPVYLIAYSILGDFALAEDAMQETFLRISQKASTYRAGTNYKAWIFSIARSVALNMRAKSSRESATSTIPESLNTDFSKKAALAIDFTRAIECLSEQEKTIVILKIGENLRHKEIAKILGISTGDCRMKYSRAIKKVRIYFSKGNA